MTSLSSTVPPCPHRHAVQRNPPACRSRLFSDFLEPWHIVCRGMPLQRRLRVVDHESVYEVVSDSPMAYYVRVMQRRAGVMNTSLPGYECALVGSLPCLQLALEARVQKYMHGQLDTQAFPISVISNLYVELRLGPGDLCGRIIVQKDLHPCKYARFLSPRKPRRVCHQYEVASQCQLPSASSFSGC